MLCILVVSISRKRNPILKQKKQQLYYLLISVSIIACSCAPINQPLHSNQESRPHYYFLAANGQTSGPLAIKSIELSFQNGQGDITLAANSQPQPQAIIAFNGNGLFQAQWQVDGRVIEQVSLNVVFGKTLKLRPLASTHFPTFEPGPHTLGLNIITPKTNLKNPVISYFIVM